MVGTADLDERICTAETQRFVVSGTLLGLERRPRLSLGGEPNMGNAKIVRYAKNTMFQMAEATAAGDSFAAILSRAVSVYSLAQHKKAHRGMRREVYVGPKAQRFLLPLIASL